MSDHPMLSDQSNYWIVPCSSPSQHDYVKIWFWIRKRGRLAYQLLQLHKKNKMAMKSMLFDWKPRAFPTFNAAQFSLSSLANCCVNRFPLSVFQSKAVGAIWQTWWGHRALRVVLESTLQQLCWCLKTERWLEGHVIGQLSLARYSPTCFA